MLITKKNPALEQNLSEQYVVWFASYVYKDGSFLENNLILLFIQYLCFLAALTNTISHKT